MSVHEPEMSLLQNFGQLGIQRKSPKNRFPLLKLPKVVLLECIENLDVLEIILLTLLSKRAKTIAKLIRWNPLDIRLTTDSRPQIELGTPINPCNRWFIKYDKKQESSRNLYFLSRQLGPEVFRSLLLKLDGNVIEEFKKMVEHICEVLRSPISDIRISDKSLIDWIINFQPTIRYVSIDDKVITTSEKLNHVLKNLKVTEYFRLGSIPSYTTFEYTKPIPSRSIIINDASWLSLLAILDGNNSIIRLIGSKLTPTDINTILKEWQMGTKLQNLEYLEFTTATLLDSDQWRRRVFNDLNRTEGDENHGRPTTVKIHDEYTYTLPWAHLVGNLIRGDGTIGTIGMYEEWKHDKMNLRQLRFYLQVWSRQA
ncbi:hypothetical protein B9Z55_012275 [Caenorhabditis nigoni]|nr:hypothetical protein B9Z55_012275 [Caenorhabditis nigoni]